MDFQWKKLLAAGLCGALVMTGFTGCAKKEAEEASTAFDAAATAITVGEDTVPVGLLKFATHYEQAYVETMYTNWGYSNVIAEEISDGYTYGEMLRSSMVNELEQAILAEQHMEEYGVSLSEEQKMAISAAASEFLSENTEEVLTLMSADQETVERYLELMTIKSLMEEQMSADIDTEVSDEEAAQRRVTYTLFTIANETEEETESDTEDAVVLVETEEAAEAVILEEETMVSEEETAALEENAAEKTQSAEETEAETGDLAAETETESETEDEETRIARGKAYAKAEELIARLQAGEDFETASAAIDEDAYCGSITFGADSTRTEMLEATDGLEDGTIVAQPVECTTGYYVIRLDTQLDREATDEEKESILEERRSDAVDALYEEWEEAAEITADDDVIETIVFDFSLNEIEEEAAEAATEAITELLETEVIVEPLETEVILEASETELMSE